MQSGSSRREHVLATGGSGYLASRIIVTLLEQGFDVRTTVRSPASARYLRETLASELGAIPTLSIHLRTC